MSETSLNVALTGTTHRLKIWPDFFASVREGRKRHEMRRDDRGFHVGDVLLLEEWDPQIMHYTGQNERVMVTEITRVADLDTPIKNSLGLNPCFAVLNDLVVMSIVRIPEP